MGTGRQAIHRGSDNELMGFVEPIAGSTQWRPLTIFGGALGAESDRDAAIAAVLERGLSSLMEKWWFFSQADERWRRVQLLEVRPDAVRGLDTDNPEPSNTVRITGSDLTSMTLQTPSS
ncbi:hypothetical protein [Antrihabitans spumae]|uniref:Uncharacterized protein n=1 Tax=Antrihabitans spumae TaxID=3373370 RepID=A0ABW7KUC3_9NOCA